MSAANFRADLFQCLGCRRYNTTEDGELCGECERRAAEYERAQVRSDAQWLPCTICRRTLVNVGDGYDTCDRCLRSQ